VAAGAHAEAISVQVAKIRHRPIDFVVIPAM
jgi:hypothetical protein